MWTEMDGEEPKLGTLGGFGTDQYSVFPADFLLGLTELGSSA